MARPQSANDRAIKEKELKWFRDCQTLCSRFPQGEPQQNPSHAPEPDIVFRDTGLGIEITEYLPKQQGGSPLRRSEVLRDRILEEAKGVFEKSSNQQVVVSVSWDPHQKLSSETNTDLAEQIARTVSGMLADSVSWWRPDWKTTEGKLLGRHVGDIWIWPRSGGISAWTSAEGGAVGDDVRRVQDRILGKECLVPKYRETCGKVWLLIVAEGRISTLFSPDEDFAQAVLQTTFDQVFLRDGWRNQVMCLSTKTT